MIMAGKEEDGNDEDIVSVGENEISSVLQSKKRKRGRRRGRRRERRGRRGRRERRGRVNHLPLTHFQSQEHTAEPLMHTWLM